MAWLMFDNIRRNVVYDRRVIVAQLLKVARRESHRHYVYCDILCTL